MLDPRERCTIAECLEHAAFETERLLHRNNSSAFGRQSRKQSASQNASRPASVIRSKTPSHIVTEVRFTPIPPDKMELGRISPDHPDVLEKRRATHRHESDSKPSHSGTSSDGTGCSSNTEPNTFPTTEPSQVDSVREAANTSRFIRKKPVISSKSAEEEAPLDLRAPSVEDTAQRERGAGVASTAAAAATRKTYSINVSGAAVPAHRSKKNPAQTAHVNTVPVKGSPLAERKTKVRWQTFTA